MNMPYISVVVPVYNEEANIHTLFSRIKNTLDQLGKPYEIVITNDGSSDQSQKILESLHEQYPEILRVVEFNGNFGQHMAIMAAFENVRGEIIVSLDADLQNPPEEIPKLIAAIESGHDAVGGCRKNRHDNLFRRYASKLNNYIRYKITHIKMQDQGCMLRAYRRNIVDLIVQSHETSAFIPALAYSLAANPGEVEVEHSARVAGESKYNLYRLLRLNFDLMTGFSLVPLQIFTVFGMVVSLCSTFFVFFLMIRRVIVGPEAEGLFTLFAVVFFLIGITLMGLGITGEYVGRIYQEVRSRPRFVVKRILQQENDQEIKTVKKSELAKRKKRA